MKNNNSKEASKINNVIGVLAIVVVGIAFISLVTTFIKISNFNKEMTGLATGYVNITVNTNLNVDVTPSSINWGNGSIVNGSNNASLTTSQNATSIIAGNWSGSGVTGLIISNTGNINCSLNINNIKNASDLWGAGSLPTAKLYQVNVSNKETGSCNGGTVATASWINFNKSSMKFCAQMSSLVGNNEVWLDVKMQIPSDLNNTDIPLSDTITITATAAG